MTTFVTSDLHLNHANIIKYCPHSRKFRDKDEMNNAIISNWNSMIGQDDLTYILGDVLFGHIDEGIELVKQLNGRKSLIIGNHDGKFLQDKRFRALFDEITSYKKIKHDGVDVVMFHFPIEVWDKLHHGSIHLHGHQHRLLQRHESCGRIHDVGLDGGDMMPYNLSKLVEKLTKLPILNHH